MFLGIPSNELVIEGVVSKPQLTPSVTTAKTTLGHSATVAARATSYKVCSMFFYNSYLKQVGGLSGRVVVVVDFRPQS
jgi:hypothetical protein